jgi:hypothetical protein
LKGHRCCDATDIIQNATEELKRLSENGFQECFQNLFRRWQKRIFAQEDYFVGTGTFGSYHIQTHICFVDRG